jgi:tRNA threonylcarbamoyladenosine biosynthesis protein TsaB
MVVLTMDTATEALAVGLGRIGLTDGASLSEDGMVPLAAATSLVPRAHSRLLQPALADLLDKAGMTASDIEGLVLGVGPGSYTGVRLAVSTAKAMALALGVPVLPVSTLWAMAETACPGQPPQPVLVMPLLYARRKRAFGAIYKKHGADWQCLVREQVRPVAEWAQELAERRESAGESSTQTVRQTMIVHDFRQSYGVMPELAPGRADQVMRLSEVAGGLGFALLRLAGLPTTRWLSGDEVHEIEPMYGLAVEAEVKLEEAKRRGHGQLRV